MGYFLTPVYVALSSISLGLAVILYVSHSIDRRSTSAPYGRFDLLLFSLLVYCIAVEGDAIISTLGADDATLTFSYFILCIFAYTLTLTYTLYASETICRNSARRKIADRSFIALYMVFMVLFLILAPGGLFFTFKDGVIHKERFFYLGVFYIYFSTFLCFLLSCCCRAPGRVKRAYLFYFLIMVFSYVLEEKLVTGSIISCAATLSVTIIYINIYSAHYRSKLEIERELTEERMRMLLWQMQPHFIYNSLSCIQQLCKNHRRMPKKLWTSFPNICAAI